MKIRLNCSNIICQGVTEGIGSMYTFFSTCRHPCSPKGPAAPFVLKAMDLIRELGVDNWVNDNRVDIWGYSLVDGVWGCGPAGGMFALQDIFDSDWFRAPIVDTAKII